jgi:hypothetical protein
MLAGGWPFLPKQHYAEVIRLWSNLYDMCDIEKWMRGQEAALDIMRYILQRVKGWEDKKLREALHENSTKEDAMALYDSPVQ